MINKPYYKTPPDGSYFFGFHDVSPWNKKNNYIILHKLAKETNSLPSINDLADIVSVNLLNKKITKIGDTNAWNYQQGSRLMWYPHLEDSVIFNFRDKDNQLSSKVLNLNGDVIKKFDFTINSLHPKKTIGVTINYERLRFFFPAYGYATLNNINDLPDTKSDGIWLVDFDTNIKELIISINEVASFLNIDSIKEKSLFLGHCSFNPSGEKFIFLARYFTDDKSGMFTSMLSYCLKTKKIKLLVSGKVSHYDWINDTELLVWMRNSKLAKAIINNDLTKFKSISFILNLLRKYKPKFLYKNFKDAFYLISTENNKKIPFLKDELTCDGHQMTSFDGNWLIVDQYPNKDKRIPINLINLETHKLKKIYEFNYETNIKNSDLKCDAHPRWSTNNEFIGVDIFENNLRSFQIINVKDIKKQF